MSQEAKVEEVPDNVDMQLTEVKDDQGQVLVPSATPYDQLANGAQMAQLYRCMRGAVLASDVLDKVTRLVDFNKAENADLLTDVVQMTKSLNSFRDIVVRLYTSIDALMSSLDQSLVGGLGDELRCRHDLGDGPLSGDEVDEMVQLGQVELALEDMLQVYTTGFVFAQAGEAVQRWAQRKGDQSLLDDNKTYSDEVAHVTAAEQAVEAATNALLQCEVKFPQLYGQRAYYQEVLDQSTSAAAAAASDARNYSDEEKSHRQRMANAPNSAEHQTFLFWTLWIRYDATYDRAREAALAAERQKAGANAQLKSAAQQKAHALREVASLDGELGVLNQEKKKLEEKVNEAKRELETSKLRRKEALAKVVAKCTQYGGGSVGHVVKAIGAVSQMYAFMQANNTIQLFAKSCKNRLVPIKTVINRIIAGGDVERQLHHYARLLRCANQPRGLAPLAVLHEHLSAPLTGLLESAKRVSIEDETVMLLEN